MKLSGGFSSGAPSNCPATKITKDGGVESRADAETVVTLHHSQEGIVVDEPRYGEDVRQGLLVAHHVRRNLELEPLKHGGR